MRLVLLLLAALCLQAQSTADRLGRSTPKTSFLGYLRAAHAGDFQRASQYMQFAPDVTSAEKPELARELLFILDRGYAGNMDALSAQPEGSQEDGVAGDRENLGSILGLEQSSTIEMVRVNEGGRPVWLFSRETVAMVPQMFPEFGFPGVERMLPRFLIDTHLLSMPLWVLIAIAVALPLALGLAWGIGWLVLRLVPEKYYPNNRPSLPLVFLIGLLLHSIVSRLLGLPLIYRIWYTRILIVLWFAVLVWLIFGVIAHLDKRARLYLARNSLSSTQAMLQLGRRILQILVLFAGVLGALKALGYDITAALAGLGIGGIAIAFAAQKTLENLFGGFSLLSDQSIRVGDSCQFGTTVANVEEIGLRATRFRTLQRSVLYIPNGQLAVMNIENLGQRDKILFRHTVGVKYGLSPDEMQKLLSGLETLLVQHPKIDADGRRARFLKFGAYSLEIELFAFVQTSDWNEFLRIQEELLIEVIRIVKDHGTDFAFPSQTLYVEQGELPFASGKTVEDGVVPRDVK